MAEARALRIRVEFQLAPLYAAGTDIGPASHGVAVAAGTPSRFARFKGFTGEWICLADRLGACAVDTVAMEPAGIEWIPGHELLEARGGSQRARCWNSRAGQPGTVILDVTGLTGQTLRRATMTGEGDPLKLAAHRDRRIQVSEAENAPSLHGNGREEPLFALQQARALRCVSGAK